MVPSAIKYGYLYLGKLRDRFPDPSHPVTIIDSDGEIFDSHMHSSQPRIDGLTKLYKKHKSQIGQTVIIKVKLNEPATAHVFFEDDPAKQTTEQQTLGKWISSGAGFGDPETNRKVEKAAIKFVTNWYTARGWNVYSVEADKCGYDLRCRKGAIEENIEVKGIQGEGLSFIITAGEVRQAQDNPHFVISVVTSALSKHPKLHRYTGAEFIKDFDFAPLAYRASLRR